MDPEQFVDDVRDANKTELSRLGSSKALYALTAGEMEPDAVLSVMADDHHAAVETYEAWAADGGAGSDLFETAAEAEREAYETVAEELDDHEPGAASPIYDVLGDAEGPVDRLGAFVGRTLIAKANRSQATGFFTGQADPGTASTFRSLGGTLADHLDGAVDALAAVCDDDEDWEDAKTAASDVVETAYDDYFETLEGMGVNPKPVC